MATIMAGTWRGMKRGPQVMKLHSGNTALTSNTPYGSLPASEKFIWMKEEAFRSI